MMMISDQEGGPLRLNRFIAMCGYGSRRSSESLIRSGRVRVNGSTVRDLSCRVVPGEDQVRLDDALISLKPKYYVIFHKPRGVVCAVSDRFSSTVIELLPRELSEAGVFPVGRLDKESEGLLLLTNDGSLSQKIAHPSGGMIKTYEVFVDRPVSVEELRSIADGTTVGVKVVLPVEVRSLKRTPSRRWISISISEGMKREVRLMITTRGLRVIRLVRRRIGFLELRDLPPGGFLKVEGERLLDMVFHGGIV
jgi:23S rRNA pseudouridine2605 synthase